MSYIALRDFDGFKKGDSIPAEIVQDRLIRGKKIGLADGSEPVGVLEIPEIKEELITEVIEVQEKEEILLEDSSAVTVEIKEEVQEETKVSKKSKK
jgi:hypothetical protein